MLLCAWTFHVNKLDLCIFTRRYTYLPEIPIYRNIYYLQSYYSTPCIDCQWNGETYLYLMQELNGRSWMDVFVYYYVRQVFSQSTLQFTFTIYNDDRTNYREKLFTLHNPKSSCYGRSVEKIISSQTK